MTAVIASCAAVLQVPRMHVCVCLSPVHTSARVCMSLSALLFMSPCGCDIHRSREGG